MSTITATVTTTITTIPLLRHRDTVVNFPADQDDFVAKYEATNDHLSVSTVPQMNAVGDQIDIITGQINVVAGEINANAVATAADVVLTHADVVLTHADVISAAASAASAAALAGAFVGTSTTSLLIGTGSKTFATQANEQYTATTWVSAVSASAPTNWMIGQVTSYNSTTGSLVINVTNTGGSGTFADWNLSLTGVPGATGPAGPAFNGGTITTELLATAGITVGGDIAFTQIDKGTVSTGTVTFTQSDGNVQRLQVGGALTIATAGWHTTGSFSDLLIHLVNGGSAIVTMPTINWVKPDGTVTTTMSTYMTAISRTAFQTSGVDFIYLWTVDGSTTIYGKLV